MKNRLNDLLSDERMSGFGPQDGVNKLQGLYDLIKTHVNQESTIVEVGSFEGKSTELFAIHCKKIYSVDPYEPYYALDYNYILNAEQTFNKMSSTYNNIVKIKKKSIDAVKCFENNSLDIIYLDGDHSYDAVKTDINIWLPKLKSGGIICGHDFTDKYGDVPTVIKEIFKDISPMVYSDSSWAIKIDKKIKEIFIVSCYPNVYGKEKLLNETVTKLKKLDKQVLITSHYPVPDYIIKKCDYYIYDAYNMLDMNNHTLDKDGCDFWVKTDNFHMETTITHHASALSRIFGITMQFVKNLGYEYFVILESDSEYDINDLKKFDNYKNTLINENKELFFCSPKFTEFSWQNERVYETYCFGGFLEKFLAKFTFPTNIDDWNNLILENKYYNCFEYLLKQKFKSDESKYLILGTLKSEFVNSKIDLYTVGECTGVFYNVNNPLQPILFLYNHDSLHRKSLYELNVNGKTFNVELNCNCWYYDVLNLESTLTVTINTYRDGSLYAEYFDYITPENINNKEKFKRIKFN